MNAPAPSTTSQMDAIAAAFTVADADRVLDPEPCDDCDTGIRYVTGFDGVRRCRNCVHVFAAERGWDKLPEPSGVDEAMRRVVAHAPEPWTAAAERAVKEVAMAMPYLTTDEVWAAMPPDRSTHENRAMGPIMTRAGRQGLIRATDEHRDSTRPEAHARPVRIWKSLMFVDDGNAPDLGLGWQTKLFD